MPISYMMSLLEKVETFINNLLILLGQLISRAVLKYLPLKARMFFLKIHHRFMTMITWCKCAPEKMIKAFPSLLMHVKSKVFGFNLKAKLQETYKISITKYESKQKSLKLSPIKKIVLTPFLIMQQWVSGLNTSQTILLLGFSSASVLAGIGVVFSGNRLMNSHFKTMRAPASIEEEVNYERPQYYKKQNRHLEIVNLRLPVYIPKVNELKSVDIDFSATLTNRQSRMKLEKFEFQLRDYLILNVEPMVSSFPLEEEGKAILREKIIAEINNFMTEKNIEGEVVDVKIIYILAN